MKKSLWLLACLISINSYFGYSQKKYCQGGALLIPRHLYVMLYDTPDGNVIDSIMNDTIKEDYLSICIKQIQNDYADIAAVYTFDSIDKEGWIQLKYLGINPANYSSKLFLHLYPNEDSTIVDSITYPQWGDLYSILKCKDDWFYIKTYNDGKWREGWMSPEDQCDNPYSTCN